MGKHSIDDMARIIGVGRPTLLYHRLRWQELTKPERVGMRQFYSAEDLQRVKNYFDSREPYQRSTKARIL